MKHVWKAYKIFNYIKIFGVVISGIAVLGMVFVISYDVFMRTVFSQSIRGGFEIIQNYFLPLIVFPSIAYVYGSGVLPKMDMLLEKLNMKLKRIIVYVLIALELFVLILIVQFSWEYAISGLEKKSAFPAGGSLYPLYPLFFIIPISFLLIIIENIFVIIRNIERKKPTFQVEMKDNYVEINE